MTKPVHRDRRLASSVCQPCGFTNPLQWCFEQVTIAHQLATPYEDETNQFAGPLLGQSSPATLSRQLARLRHLGVIKRVLGTYRYYLTRAGRAAIAAGRRLTEHTIIPALA